MTFLDALSVVPDKRMLISTNTGSLTAGQLRYNSERLRYSFSGRRVGVNMDDPIEGITAIAAADGYAESITLLPRSLTAEDTIHLAKVACCDLFLGSRFVGFDPARSFDSCSSVSGRIASSSNDLSLRRNTTWNIATSGTTNTPKLVAHTFSSLRRTVNARLNDTPIPIWGLMYEYMRFAGLQVVLQSLLAGSHLVAFPREVSVNEKVRFLAESGCTHLSATPTLWRAVLMSPASKDLPLRQITLGGEIVDDRILHSLRVSYPAARITHIYASTEAGVGFSVKDGKSGFPLAFLVTPPAGLELRINNDRLYVRSFILNPKYVGTDDAFAEEQGWVDTGDSVTVIKDRVYFLGRSNGVINVGGNKVFPEEIEQLLLNQGDIHAARIYGKRSSIMGSIVVADLVLRYPEDNIECIKKRIIDYLVFRTEKYKIPAIINIVPSLDPTPSGKLNRSSKS